MGAGIPTRFHEASGCFESSVNKRFKEAPVIYFLYTALIVSATNLLSCWCF